MSPLLAGTMLSDQIGLGNGMLVQRQHSSSFTNNDWGENDVRACVFGVFRALNILNGYV